MIIILAAAVILTISKNNPVESAKEATFKEDLRAFQDDLALTISKEYTSKQGQREEKITTSDYNEIKEKIPSFTEKYEGKFEIIDDKLVGTNTLTEREKKWSEELNIPTSGTAPFDAEEWNKTASDDNCFVWDTDNTTIIGYNEDPLNEVTTLRIPSKCTAIRSDSVTAWNGYRNFVGGITKIEIPETVTEIGDYAFAYFDKLTSVNIPNCVTSIGDDAFSGCSNLTSITIPGSVTSIGNYAFSGCSNLTSIIIPNGVTSIGSGAFSGCSGLTGSITIPSSVTSIESGTFMNCRNLTNITIPEGVTSIKKWAFYKCNLEKIIIPKSVVIIENDAFEKATIYSNKTIYCRVRSQPTGWQPSWNFKRDYEAGPDDTTYYEYYEPVWGYTGN